MNTVPEKTVGEILRFLDTLVVLWEEGESIVEGHIIPNVLKTFEDLLYENAEGMGVTYVRKYDHIKI